MLTSLVSLWQGNTKKVEKLTKTVNIEVLKSSSILNKMRNSNEIFRENMTYNIESHKIQGFTLSLENVFLEKPQGGSN